MAAKIGKQQTAERRLDQRIINLSSFWVDEQLVRLGNYSSEVLSDEAGMLYARQYNGDVIKVYNGRANVPATFNLHVRVGHERGSDVWQIIEIQDDYDQPASSGFIAHHHRQHEFDQPDAVFLDKRQILDLSVLVVDPSNFIIQVFGAIIRTASGLGIVLNEQMNLSSYVVSSGAKFVNVEYNDAGTLSVNNTGTVFGSPLLASISNIPIPAIDKHLLATVLMFESQAELLNSHIRVIHQLYGGQTGAAVWGDITGTLADQTDLQAELDDKADIDHVHIIYPVLLMQDGVTDPPVPVENEDGTDWLYSDV